MKTKKRSKRELKNLRIKNMAKARAARSRMASERRHAAASGVIVQAKKRGRPRKNGVKAQYNPVRTKLREILRPMLLEEITAAFNDEINALLGVKDSK